MKPTSKKRLTKRDQVYLKVLKNCDLALYKLWQQTEMFSPMMYHLNYLQKNFVQAEIRRLEGAA